VFVWLPSAVRADDGGSGAVPWLGGWCAGLIALVVGGPR
jgi:hypothetical protein